MQVDGQGYATFSTQTLGLGQHTITAIYSGDNYRRVVPRQLPT